MDNEWIADQWDSVRADLQDAHASIGPCPCGCEDVKNGRTPSVYQSAILHAFKNEQKNILIQAVAGSGKTSTLVMLAGEMRGSAVFLAFNRSIADELRKKLPESVQVSTFHALGWNAVRPVLQQKLGGRLPGAYKDWIQANKTVGIFRDLYGGSDLTGAESATVKLVSLMKAHLLREDASDSEMGYLVSHFDVTCEDESISDDALVACARTVLKKSNETLFPIDFDDQLYMCALFSVRMPTVDFVMVDECQDTNAARRWILERMVKSGARLIAVGDVNQAIYGFTGADADSMQRIREAFGCVEMPLSISYRCARSVVTEAQNYVSGILPADNAPEGTVRGVSVWRMREFRPDDLVVCRNTAPLVRVAYSLIAARIPCKIMGRDIAAGLISLCEKVAGRGCRDLSTLVEKLTAYRDREVQRAMERGQDAKAQSVSDRVDTVLTLIDSLTDDDRKDGVQGLIAREDKRRGYPGGVIARMFTDNGGQVTTFSTVHKAKGMEAPRVFILDQDLMPSRYARQPWQQVQERNLQYVAVTRAMQELVYVSSDGIE